MYQRIKAFLTGRGSPVRLNRTAVIVHQRKPWSTDEALWPADRTRELFDKWFDVRVAELVEDMGRGKLERD